MGSLTDLRRDECRELDDDTLLGLSFVEAPGLRRLGTPFLLERAA